MAPNYAESWTSSNGKGPRGRQRSVRGIPSTRMEFPGAGRGSPISDDDHWLGFTAPPVTIEHWIEEEFFRAMLT
jgi:hypothetical protein